MANDLDQLPVYDPISKRDSGLLTDVWVGAFSYLIQNLVEYLTQGGILIPRLTTAQRDLLRDVQEGQLIYNTDSTPGPPRTAEIQVWQVKADVGAWRVITTTP